MKPSLQAAFLFCLLNRAVNTKGRIAKLCKCLVQWKAKAIVQISNMICSVHFHIGLMTRSSFQFFEGLGTRIGTHCAQVQWWSRIWNWIWSVQRFYHRFCWLLTISGNPYCSYIYAYKKANGSVPAVQVQCALPPWTIDQSDHTLLSDFSGSKTNRYQAET